MKKKSLQKGKHVLTMGSACTGMGTESFALSAMRRPHHMLFACELKRHMRAFISKHHAPRKTLKDVENPTFQTVPFVNLFVAGFPCQPFSLAGMGKGVEDARGVVVAHLVRWIKKRQPDAWILENVEGLLVQHYDILKAIIESLRFKGASGKAVYSVSVKLLNSLDFSVPQALSSELQID